MQGPKPKPPSQCESCEIVSTLIRGFCKKCYTRLRRHGFPLKESPALPDTLSPVQSEVLTGLMLGDGCVYRRKNSHQAHLIVVRSRADKDYLCWNRDVFKEFACRFADKDTFDKRTQSTYFSSVFTTHRSKVFDIYRDKWYNDRLKRLPDYIPLTPLTIAVWFADDGSVCSTCAPWRLKLKLSTHGFQENEVERLKTILSTRYSEKFYVQKTEGKFCIETADSGCRAFCEEIDAHLPNSIQRKATWRNPSCCFYENQPKRYAQRQ